MRRLAFRALLTALLAAAPAIPSEAAPRRIVSLNLCTDQLVLALADRGQIAALSPLAADPSVSAAAEAARGLPRTGGTAEEALALAPDLVLLGPLDRLGTGRILEAHGIRVERMALPTTFAETQDAIRRIAALLGHPARGEALARRLDAPAAIPGPAPTALPYERRGYAAGPASLMGEVLARAGFRHGAPATGLGGFVPLETIVAVRPDVLVLGDPPGRTGDQGSALLAHPALARLYPPARRIVVPDVLTACPGPGLVAAVERLAAARRALR